MTAAPHERPATALLPALAVGFGGVIVSWVLAWILHLPAIDASARVTLPILLLGLVATFVVMLRDHPAAGRVKVGLLAGLVCGLVSLLIVGSLAVEQPESTDSMANYANRFRSEAWFIVPASILLCVGAGALGGALSRGGRGRLTTRSAWLARLALVTVFIYLPLIAVGGAVTSTESGLAVPDAVTSYGAVSFLFPFQLMAEPRIFLEHSHRLFGTLAGLTTIVLMVCVLLFEPRRTCKILAVALLLAVSFQGWMGIKRVSELSTPAAIAHGVFGQIVFSMAGLLAAALSIAWIRLDADPERRQAASRGVKIAFITVGALLLQLAMGAAARHLDRMDPPSPGASHARLTHAGFAFVVMLLIIIAGALAMRAGKAGKGQEGVRRLGIGLHALVTFQFLLGWAALGLIMTREGPAVVHTADRLAEAPPIRTVEALVTTTHQASGALLLMLAVVTAAWLHRLARGPGTEPVHAEPAPG